MKQTPHELVGNVRSSRGKNPPIAEALSSMWTRWSFSANSRAACIPAMPPPITSTSLFFPFTIIFSPTLFMKDSLIKDSSIPEANLSHLKSGSAILANSFNLNESYSPLWLFRSGLSKQSRRNFTTLRENPYKGTT